MKRLLIAAALVAVTGCSNNQGPKTIAFECTGLVDEYVSKKDTENPLRETKRVATGKKEKYSVRFVIDPANERGNGTEVYQGGKPIDQKDAVPWTVDAKIYPKTIEITDIYDSGFIKKELSLDRKTGELLKFEEFKKGFETFASWEWEKDPWWTEVKCKRVR